MKQLSLILLAIFPFYILAQNPSPKTLTFDYQGIRSNINSAKLGQNRANVNQKITVDLPTPNGTIKSFEVEETSNFNAELSNQFPEIQTFTGVCVKDKSLSVRFDISPLGFSGAYVQQGNFDIIEPKDLLQNLYQITPFDETQHGWECGLDTLVKRKFRNNRMSAKANISSGNVLRTFRVAIATTGEFTNANGGQTQALSRINNFLTIINAMYIKELSIQFALVNNTNIIFTDASADPFNPAASSKTNESGTAFRGFNTSGILAFSSYDFGFTLHVNGTTGSGTSASGVATLDVICDNFSKGQMWTQYAGNNTNSSINSLVGGILIHEIAHQFGASHTFNGQGGNCTNQLGDQFEPGSGTTIMSYRGLCSSQNLSGSADNYFHISSLESILLGISLQPSCGTTTTLTNTVPVVNAGTDYTVPANTPFLLKATATDANGDALSYTWDENDEGIYNDAGALGQTNGVGGYSAVRSRTAPLFRSRQSTTSTQRSFPRIDFILNNANNPTDTEGEDLSIAQRIMKFTFTARDNKTTGGGTVSDDILITVDSLKGPFLVTSPNTNVGWEAGSSKTITWSVNNTNLLSPNIDIQISSNGGTSFTTLVSNTPNDGSETVIIPSNTPLNATARIKIVSTNSTTAEFFDISDTNFTVTAPSSCPASNATFLSTKTGLWNDLTVWNCGNRLPGATDTVRIVAGHVITLNVNAQIKALNVLGSLVFQAGRVLSY
ncbi:MAG: M12 family metallo-peptidase [Arcicella sp.]|nr:M12 family metallo-peptidase [Arcicella sp.]